MPGVQFVSINRDDLKSLKATNEILQAENSLLNISIHRLTVHTENTFKKAKYRAQYAPAYPYQNPF